MTSFHFSGLKLETKADEGDRSNFQIEKNNGATKLESESVKKYFEKVFCSSDPPLFPGLRVSPSNRIFHYSLIGANEYD